MAMKLGKLVTYDEVRRPMTSRVPQTTWSHEVTQQPKNQIFLPSEDV